VRVGGGLVFGLAVVACALVVRVPFLPYDRAHDRGLPRLLDAALDDAPPAGTALVMSDNLAAGLAFAQVVEGARPDLAVLVRQHLWDPSAVEPVRRRLPGHFGDWRPGAPQASLPALREPARRAGVRWEGAPGSDPEGVPAELSPGFPLFRAGGTPETAALAVQSSEALAGGGVGGVVEERNFLAGWRLDYADWLMAHGREAEAEAVYDLVLSGLGRPAQVFGRRAAALARLGRFDAAAELASRAALLEPWHTGHRLSLSRYLLNGGRPNLAAPLLDELLDENGETAEALGLRGLVRAQSGDREGARSDFEAALGLDPRQPEAAYGLKVLTARP